MLDYKDSFQLETRERTDHYQKGATIVEIRATNVPQPIAVLALDFITRWGMVACVDDGEDTAGRSKVRLATPKELVDRAVEVAELAFKIVQEKGWTLHIPEAKQPTLKNEPTPEKGDKQRATI